MIKCEEVKGLRSAFQKHGAECTGFILIFNVAEIRPIKADKLLRQLVTRKRGQVTHHTASREGERRTIEREAPRHTIEGEALIER